MSAGKVGARLRQERQARGWDMSQMVRELRRAAVELGVEVSKRDNLVDYVGRWERGAVGVSERYRLVYARAFATSPEALFGCGAGLPAGREETDRLTVAWLVGRVDRPVDAEKLGQLTAVAEVDAGIGTVDPIARLREALYGPAGVSSETVVTLETRTVGFFRLRDALHGSEVFPGLLEHLGEVAAVLEVCPAGLMRRRAAATAGEAAALAGLIAQDLGDTTTAGDFYEVARRAAREAGDPAPIACAMTFRDALRINARGALARARRLYPAITTRVPSTQAPPDPDTARLTTLAGRVPEPA